MQNSSQFFWGKLAHTVYNAITSGYALIQRKKMEKNSKKKTRDAVETDSSIPLRSFAGHGSSRAAVCLLRFTGTAQPAHGRPFRCASPRYLVLSPFTKKQFKKTSVREWQTEGICVGSTEANRKAFAVKDEPRKPFEQWRGQFCGVKAVCYRWSAAQRKRQAAVLPHHGGQKTMRFEPQPARANGLCASGWAGADNVVVL
jgi:hypothetical protein